MADCKKCLHAPVCEKLPKMPGAMVAECDDLKDRTKWVERPKGRWVWDEMFSDYTCGVCHNWDLKTPNFCSNCGADMRGTDNDV